MYPTYDTARVRIYPNELQKAQIERTLQACRIIRERYHAKWQEMYEAAQDKAAFWAQCMDNSIFMTLRNDFNAYKLEAPWFSECDKWGLYGAFLNESKLWKTFVDRVVRLGETPDLPQSTTNEAEPQSYKSDTRMTKLLDGTIILPHLGAVKCSASDEAKHIMDCTVTKDNPFVSVIVTRNPSGNYYVSLTYTGAEYPNTKLPQSAGIQRVVGIDLGLHDALTLSYGEKIQNPRHRYQADEKLKELQRQLKRYTPGSGNYNKTRVKIAKLREHIQNQRADFIHKITNDLVTNYDIICVETLDAREMLKQNRFLTTAMGDAGWYEFFRQLDYKARRYGKTVISVPLNFPSSQICSVCGARHTALKDLNIREWTCPECRTVHDRDINAARNILHEGLRHCSMA